MRHLNAVQMLGQGRDKGGRFMSGNTTVLGVSGMCPRIFSSRSSNFAWKATSRPRCPGFGAAVSPSRPSQSHSRSSYFSWFVRHLLGPLPLLSHLVQMVRPYGAGCHSPFPLPCLTGSLIACEGPTPIAHGPWHFPKGPADAFYWTRGKKWRTWRRPRASHRQRERKREGEREKDRQWTIKTRISQCPRFWSPGSCQ